MTLLRVAPQAGTIGTTGPTGPTGITGPNGTTGVTGTAGASITFYAQTTAPGAATNGDLWYDTDAPSQNTVHPFLLMGA